jgi:hypothetical protein
VYVCVCVSVCMFKVQGNYNQLTKVATTNHHQPINVPTAGELAFLMDYT